MKQKAALQQLRATIGGLGDDTSTSYQRDTEDVELMYDGVQYLEHLLLSHQEREYQTAPTDLDVLHRILEVWYHERRHSRDSPVASMDPSIMLRWVDLIATSMLGQATGALATAPNRETYRYLMDADVTNVELIEELFERMLRTEDPDLSPTVDDFHRVMHANIQGHKVQRAESYLQSLLQLHRSDDCGAYQPTVRTYNTLIAAYAKLDRPQDATRVLQQLIDDGFIQGPIGQASYSFETCLNAWVASRHKSAGHRAETLILQMQRLGMRPSEKSLVKVIAAWAQTKRENAPKRAQAILQLLLSMVDDNDSTSVVQHSADRGRAVLDGYLHVVRAFALTATRDRTAPDQCHRLLKELLGSKHVSVHSDSSSMRTGLRKICALVCLSWARSKRRDAVQNIERVFHQLETELGVPLDRFCCNALLEAHARVGDGAGALRSWNRFFEVPGPGQHAGMQPSIDSVNQVLLALSRSKEEASVLEAENFWARIRDLRCVKPNVVTFNVLLALAGKGDPHVDSARRGESYLQELVNLYREGDSSCRPNVVTFSKAIELWGNIKTHPEEAKECVQAHWVSMQRQRMEPSEATRKIYLNVLHRSA